MSDDEKARKDRALRLRKKIDEIDSGKTPADPRVPESPNDFIERRMREEREASKNTDD